MHTSNSVTVMVMTMVYRGGSRVHQTSPEESKELVILEKTLK